MKLSIAGLLVTVLVIVLGVMMIAPIFARTAMKTEPLKVVLLFSVKGENSTRWCEDVGSYLAARGIHATVFFSGKNAFQSHGVSSYNDGVDIGSMTYDYVNITSISDYELQLDEIARGKLAVESAGGLTSRVFMAPFGSVNDDIYSQLNRVGIVADFSYDDHYNKVYEGQFIRMELKVFDYSRHSPEFYLSISDKREPVAIRFDDSVNPSDVTGFISQLTSGNVRFINASELTGLQLTFRG